MIQKSRWVLAVALLVTPWARSSSADDGRATGEKHTFRVEYTKFPARYSAEVTAWPTVALGGGRIGVTLNAEVRTLDRQDPGGIARVEWEIELSNVGTAFTEVRAYFNTGTAVFRAGGSADLPGYSSNFRKIEVDYDWCGNRQTLVFADFSFDPGPSAPLRQGRVFLLRGSHLPRVPQETPAELAALQEREAAEARRVGEERQAASASLEGEDKAAFAQATAASKRMQDALLRGAPQAERNRLRQALEEASKRSLALSIRRAELEEEAARLLERAKDLEASAAELRKLQDR